jgi:lipopolysaccharide export system permease protein
LIGILPAQGGGRLAWCRSRSAEDRRGSAGFSNYHRQTARCRLSWSTIVRILDKQRYWSFVKAYLICYVSLVGLYIVIDAFSNIDEFYKRADDTLELFKIMGRYYLVHQSQFFDQLSGVIGMMAAVFTVTWMQRNNEQLAMLAAGVSTHRAILPVLFSSVVVSSLVAINQEAIMPRYAEELSKSHDDDGIQKVHVSTRYDSQGVMLQGYEADRATRSIMPCYATIPRWALGRIRDVKGDQATYVPPDHPTAPLKGGWLIRGATINPPFDEAASKASARLLIPLDDLRGFPPPYVARSKGAAPSAVPAPARLSGFTPHSEIAYLASLPTLPLCLNPAILRTYMSLDGRIETVHGNYFLKSTLTFQAVTRKPNWYQYATTPDLLQGLTDPSTEGSERTDVAMFLHVRFLRPVLGMNLLFMSLPLVLGGYGRNTFISLGLALGNSAMFYGAIILCQYLGSFAILTPALAAWVPLFGFGTIAALRWGRIRT